jgi:SHS2 domain-containing protein
LPGGHKIVEHTADVGIRVWGQTQRELFEEAALGTVARLYDPETIAETESVRIELEADTLDELLLQWLKEILRRIDEEGLVFHRFQIEKDTFNNRNAKTYQIEASLHGEKLDRIRHDICLEIKAVTRHGLYVKKNGPWWEGNVLFDV